MIEVYDRDLWGESRHGDTVCIANLGYRGGSVITLLGERVSCQSTMLNIVRVTHEGNGREEAQLRDYAMLMEHEAWHP